MPRRYSWSTPSWGGEDYPAGHGYYVCGCYVGVICRVPACMQEGGGGLCEPGGPVCATCRNMIRGELVARRVE